MAGVDAPAARIAAWGRFSNDGAPARNHGAIMLSKIMQPNQEHDQPRCLQDTTGVARGDADGRTH